MRTLLVIVLLFASTVSAAEIKLAPGTWTGHAKVVITIDQAGNQTVTIDPSAPVTITGGGGVVPPGPIPVVVPPADTLSGTVKAATAAVFPYPNKDTHRRSMAFGMSFLAQATANTPVPQARQTVRQFCDAAVGADAAKWASWWVTVDAKLDAMQLTPATYTAALGEMATALTNDLPPAERDSRDVHGQRTFGLDPEIIRMLIEILLPLLLKLLGLQ